MSAALVAIAVGCGDADEEPSAGDSEPTGRVLLFGYEQDGGPIDGESVSLYSVDPPAGTVQRSHLPHMGIGDPLEFIEVSGDRLVFYGRGGATFSTGLDLEEQPKLLGESWYFVASATDGRAWLTFLDHQSSPQRRDLIGVEEVTVDGEVVVDGHTARPPCPGPTIVAAVREALLCQNDQELIAFDPRSGDVLRRMPGPFPLASGGDLVASCGEPCPRLRINDPVAGTEFELEPEPSFRWTAGYEGAFTRDASFLAVPVEPTSPGAGRNARSVALIDVAARSIRLIEGSETAVGRTMTFSPSGEWLFFVSNDEMLMAYQRGDERATAVADLGDLVILDLAVA
jgi:hypothetical protein